MRMTWNRTATGDYPRRDNQSVQACVLVVEDDAETLHVLQRHLEREHYRVITAHSGAAALRCIDECAIDITLLDLALPDIRGEDVLREHRQRGIPVVVLTAPESTEQRIRGLELGADDCVTKPFSPRELTLRIRSVLRRCTPSGSNVASFGGGRFLVDEYRHEMLHRGEVLHVTPGEWSLLSTLAAHPGRAYSRLDLVMRIHGGTFEGYERTIDGHVHNLRRKLCERASAPCIIETVPGVGYRFGLRRDQGRR